MKTNNMSLERCYSAAREAFELKNSIEINESAGLEPEKIIKRVYASQKLPVTKITIVYTLAELGGCWSDSMYHVIEPKKPRKDVYEFNASDNTISLNGGPAFNKPWLESTKERLDAFYKAFPELRS